MINLEIYLHLMYVICWKKIQKISITTTRKRSFNDACFNANSLQKKSFSDTFFNDTFNKCEQKSTYSYIFRKSVSIV